MAKLNIPAQIRAGDTLKFTDAVESYSAADGWTLRYVLVNGSQKISLNSSASGSDHKFLVAITDSKQWQAGSYQWQAFADGVDSEKHTVATGKVRILPDFSQGPTDQRHHVEKVLAAIESTLEGKATIDAEETEINGLSVKRYSPEKLIVWRDKYRSELASLKRAEKLANGEQGSGGKILVRF